MHKINYLHNTHQNLRHSKPRRYRNALLAFWVSLCAALLWGAGLAEEAAAANPASIVIDRPQPGATVHNNSGDIEVAIGVHGIAFTTEHRVRVLIDGTPHGTNQRVTRFTLHDIERGEHTLQVQLLSRDNAFIAASPAVTFNMWRASRLFPNRKPSP